MVSELVMPALGRAGLVAVMGWPTVAKGTSG